mgnify:CR=1 FL=1
MFKHRIDNKVYWFTSKKEYHKVLARELELRELSRSSGGGKGLPSKESYTLATINSHMILDLEKQEIIKCCFTFSLEDILNEGVNALRNKGE